MFTKRDFLEDEVWKRWKTDEEQMLQFRNQVAAKGGKPSQEDLAVMAVNKPWLAFYKVVLNDKPKKN